MNASVVDRRVVRIPSGRYELSTVVAGEGPLVILMHGWPELGTSWRHQIAPLAAAGFTVAVPDMRGYGASSKPDEVEEYGADALADDMAAIADGLAHRRWVSIGHDWGAAIAWRTALRFPDRVAAVFSLSVPHLPPPPVPMTEVLDLLYPNRFHYIRYFQQVGAPERELERDVRASLKQIFFSLSGDAPKFDWVRERPFDAPLLPSLTPPPPGPLSFMDDAELDAYAAAFTAGGFFGPISWYRTLTADQIDQQAYGDGVIHQPSGFLCGDKEIVLAMLPAAFEAQRALLADLRAEILLPDAGHWIQQERPAEVRRALLAFLDEVRPAIDASG